MTAVRIKGLPCLSRCQVGSPTTRARMHLPQLPTRTAVRAVALALAVLQVMVFVMYWLLVPAYDVAPSSSSVVVATTGRAVELCTAHNCTAVPLGTYMLEDLRKYNLHDGMLRRVKIAHESPTAVFVRRHTTVLATFTHGSHTCSPSLSLAMNNIVVTDAFDVLDPSEFVEICDEDVACVYLDTEETLTKDRMMERFGVRQAQRISIPPNLILLLTDGDGRPMDVLTHGVYGCTGMRNTTLPLFCKMPVPQWQAKSAGTLLHALEIQSWLTPVKQLRASLIDEWQRVVTFNSDQTIGRLKGVPANNTIYQGVTLVLQLSVTRLSRLLNIAEHWPGYMSIVIYLTNPWDLLTVLDFWARHVTQTDHSQRTKSWNDHNRRLAITRTLRQATWTIVKPDYRKSFLEYPINKLRNIGIKNSRTDVVFVIDADFVPDRHLYERANRFIVTTIENHYANYEDFAYVVNCVALTPEASIRPPQSLSDLRSMVHTGNAFLTSSVGHGTSKLPILLDYPFAPRISMNQLHSYEVCFESQWEPYYFLHRSAPLYDERFTNQGGDKQQHTVLLNAMGFRFRVLHNHFIYHLPHEPSMSWPGGGLRAGASDKTFRFFEDYLPELEQQYGKLFRLPRCPLAFTANVGSLGEIYTI